MTEKCDWGCGNEAIAWTAWPKENREENCLRLCGNCVENYHKENSPPKETETVFILMIYNMWNGCDQRVGPEFSLTRQDPTHPNFSGHYESYFSVEAGETAAIVVYEEEGEFSECCCERNADFSHTVTSTQNKYAEKWLKDNMDSSGGPGKCFTYDTLIEMIENGNVPCV